MAGASVQKHRYDGTEICVEKVADLCLRRVGSAVTTKLPRWRYTWRPPDAFQEQLPQGFELASQCVLDTEGLRRFYPWNSFETFLALASTGGLAILCQRQNLTGNQRHSYRAMRSLFLRAHHMVEHFR